ncbi:MAG: dihydroorotase [Gammaproteobacteria bacterium]
MFERLVRGDLVLPDRVLEDGYLGIDGGKISAVGVRTPPDAREVIDASGKLVFPGVIDGQVHAGSATGIEGLADATVAAAAGGVTTIVDMPFDDPDPVNSVARLQRKVDAIDRSATVDVALYATARKGAGIEGIQEMADAGACAFKVSTYEYHPVRFPGYDTGELLELFPAIRDTGLSVAFHNEDPYIVKRLTDELHKTQSNAPQSHGLSRPPVAELIANVSVFEIARITGVRCHIVHSSLARGFEHVKQYRRQGVRASAETCVQYLVFCENDVLEQGARLKQNPPIRSAAENAALWEKLVNDEIDFVSSDHVAWPMSRKSDPDFFNNGSGVPGLETLFHALYTGMVTERGMDPTRVAALLCERPARHFGLYPRKGALIPGADADFALVERRAWTFDESKMVSEVKWSPYHGLEFGARVIGTYVRGVPVFERGRVTGEPGGGEFIRPVA